MDTFRSFARGRYSPRGNPSAAAIVGLSGRVGAVSLVVLLLASPVAQAMQSDIPQARAFGVIAVSEQNYWAGSDYPNREQAEADAMAACHAEASDPEDCRIQAVYEWPQCGAVASGDNGRLAVRTAQDQVQAENAAMAACRNIPGNAGCAVQATCAMSPEARARSQAIREKVVGWMGDGLRAIYGLPPAAVDEPLVGPEDPHAQYELGLAHHRGNGASQDYRLAARWYQKAVAQGYAPAQLNLGAMYQMGQGVPQDLAKAADLYEKAAMQGEVEAQVNLGMLYHQGLGVPLDQAQAAAWYRKAAAQGHQRANEMLELLADAQTNQERIRQLEAERRVLEDEEAVARSRGADLEIERQRAAAAVAKARRDYENYTGQPAPAAVPIAKGVAASLGMFPSHAAALAALAGRPARIGQRIDVISTMGRKLYRAIIGVFQDGEAVTAYCKAQGINCVIVR